MDYQQEKYLKERQQKQQFLVENVLQQGYNPQEFAQYMGEKKENGVDVDSWTFTQLSYLVEEFKIFARPVNEPQVLIDNRIENQAKETDNLDQYYNQKGAVPQNQSLIMQQINQHYSQSASQAQQIENELQDAQNRMSQIQVQEVFQDRIKTVKTILTKATVLNNANTSKIDIFLHDGRVEQSKKVFKTTQYLTFRVQTPRFSWDVKRKDEEFNALQQYLKKQYPHILIPPITSFKAGKKFDSVFIQKRSRILEKFLRCMMRSEELKSDHILLVFLQSNDAKEFESIMKLSEKEVGAQKVQDLVTFNGEIQINESQYSYFARECEELPQFVKQLEGNYRRIYQQMKRLGEDLKSVSSTIQNIQESIQQVSQTHQQFSPEKQGLGLPQVLNMYSDMLSQWSNSYVSQKQVFHDNMTQFFHYYALQGDQIQQFYNGIQTRLEEIKKKEKVLNDKKEKLFAQFKGDFSLWDLPQMRPEELQMVAKDKYRAIQIMLPKETAQITDLKDMFTVLVQSFKYEVSKADDWEFEEMKEHFGKVSEPIMQSYHNHLMIWNQFDQKLKTTFS